jgi:hypothetical protein
MQQVPKRVIFEKGKVKLTKDTCPLKNDISYPITDWDPESQQFTCIDEEGEEWMIDFIESYYMDDKFNDFTLIYENPSFDNKVPSFVIFETEKAEIDSSWSDYFEVDKKYKVIRHWKEAGIFAIHCNGDVDSNLVWFRENLNAGYPDEYSDFDDPYDGEPTFIYDEVEFYEIW